MNALKGKFDRLGQTLSEKLGGGDKTTLEPELQKQLDRLDEVKKLTGTILADIEAYAQPDSTLRVLPKMTSGDNRNKPEVLSVDLKQLSARLDKEDAYGKALESVSEGFHKVGQAEREFLNTLDEKYVTPVKAIIENEFKTLTKEQTSLEDRRLDLDAYRAKLKGKEPAEDDELFKTTTEAYHTQVDKVKEVATAADAKLPELKEALKAFIEADVEFTAKKKQCLDDLAKNL